MDVFNEFRPIYSSFIGILIILSIYVILNKNRLDKWNGFMVISISFITLIVSTYMTYLAGVLTDELTLSGDPVSFYMFIATALLSIINVIAYFYRRSS